jgi:hypothetical protein
VKLNISVLRIGFSPYENEFGCLEKSTPSGSRLILWTAAGCAIVTPPGCSNKADPVASVQYLLDRLGGLTASGLLRPARFAGILA